MSKCVPNELIRNILYFILSLLLLGVNMKAKCPKWWAILHPLLQGKAIKANQTILYMT